MGKTALKIDGQKVLIVYEEDKAPWSKPLCKLGFHDWVMRATHFAYKGDIIPILKGRWAGFNNDNCRRNCGVGRYWMPHVRQ